MMSGRICRVAYSPANQSVLVAQSCLTLCDPMDCSPPGSSVHGISQARILEWVAISFSRGSSRPRDRIWDFCIAGRFSTTWASREVKGEDKTRARSPTSMSQTVTWNFPSGTDSAQCLCTEPRKAGWHLRNSAWEQHSYEVSFRTMCSKKEQETGSSICRWAQWKPPASGKTNMTRNVWEAFLRACKLETPLTTSTFHSCKLKLLDAGQNTKQGLIFWCVF